MEQLTFIDIFAGIGGFHMGMEQAGYKCVGYIEIDKFARKSYEAIYETKGLWSATDITIVRARDLPEADCYCAGFPCQAFSIAGKQGGLEDTRGTLVFEVLRLAQERQPKILFFENVKGLLSHDNGRTFATILNAITELGYDVQWKILNSKNFGVPQNRERVFIVGHLRGTCRRAVFPIIGKGGGTLKQIIGGSQGQRVYDTEGVSCTQASEAGGLGAKTGLYAVLTPDRLETRQNGRRFKAEGEPMFTLTGQHIHGVADGTRIRRLTPLECWRLQGFPDWAFYKAKDARVSETQLYKQAGNGVSVPVVYEIAKRL